MKKLFYLILFIIPFNVFAQSMPLTEYFKVDNSSTQPYHFTISGNSNKNVEFSIDYLRDASVENEGTIPGSYLLISIVSSKKLKVERKNSFGTYCGSSCFSNDVYLQQLEHSNNSYSYAFYFNIVKWKITLGNSALIQYQVWDDYKFTNLESGTADVYLYGAYSNDVNEMKGLINDVNTTNNIIDNNNQNTQDIIDNNDDNTQTIIDNDNANTDKIIESNKVCSDYDKSNIKTDNYYLYSGIEQTDPSGTELSSTSWGITDYISIDKDSDIYTMQTFTSYTFAGLCFYNINKTLISCMNTTNTSSTLNIPTNSSYVRFSINKSQNKPQFKVCRNGNQAITDNINDLNDNITNSGIDSPNSDFSDMENMLAQNGVITNLLVLPITLYTAVLNSVNGTCSTFSLGSLYGTNLSFSCVNIQSFLGSTIYNTIDILISGFFVYHISRKMVKVFNNMSSLKEGDVLDD